MFPLKPHAAMTARLSAAVLELSIDSHAGIDAMRAIQHLAGMLLETCMIFEEPDTALQASFDRLACGLGTKALAGRLSPVALPPAHLIDYETERGRFLAREFFVEWLECPFDFHAQLLLLIQHLFIEWEIDGQSRAKSLRLLMECGWRCMALEISAQELCDIVIEEKVAIEGWSLGDCIAALSAVAGRRLALSLNFDACDRYAGSCLPENLDCVVHVMTQEAVRLGVPVGSNWRFGLPANDMPSNAPYELVQGIEPACCGFFSIIGVSDLYIQAVACAKAAGRMLAVAAGGDSPQIEPAIAKPLAMAAITETYRSVCMMHEAVVY